MRVPFLRTDHWRSAIVKAPMEAIVAAGTLEGFDLVMLPDLGPMRFLADPFGLWRDGSLHVFAEAYDYRDRHGVIMRLAFDAEGRVISRRIVLRTAYHLSYPVPITQDGEVFLLPEATCSGTLSLYRATDRTLDHWEAVPEFVFPTAAIDASPVRFQGAWWMFYTPPGGDGGSRQSTLCAAWAPRLTGPWTEHPANPILVDRAGARPGGTPCVIGDTIVLPTQDCRATYGAAIRLVHLRIDPRTCAVTGGARLSPPERAHPYRQGLHTLSAAGDVTLIDVKRIGIGGRRHWLDLRRRVGRGARVNWSGG